MGKMALELLLSRIDGSILEPLNTVYTSARFAQIRALLAIRLSERRPLRERDIPEPSVFPSCDRYRIFCSDGLEDKPLAF